MKLYTLVQMDISSFGYTFVVLDQALTFDILYIYYYEEGISNVVNVSVCVNRLLRLGTYW